jgi:hypothetical protein
VVSKASAVTHIDSGWGANTADSNQNYGTIATDNDNLEYDDDEICAYSESFTTTSTNTTQYSPVARSEFTDALASEHLYSQDETFVNYDEQKSSENMAPAPQLKKALTWAQVTGSKLVVNGLIEPVSPQQKC